MSASQTRPPEPREGSVGQVKTRHVRFNDPLRLECGSQLEQLTLAYETYGKLNARRDNAVLVVHALSGDAHAAGYHGAKDRKPGWWDVMIGPGKALDTNRYYVICSNVLGGCQGSTGPSSPRPDNGLPYGSAFPAVTIGDMVRAQTWLLDYLGLETLHAVIGGSMGGMQALEWLTAYPERVRKGVVIASTMAHSAQQIAFNETGRQAIIHDPLWQDGDYYGTPGPWRGLAVARMMGHITYLSEEGMEEKFGRSLQGNPQRPLDPCFAVEHYLHHQGRSFINRFDANSYLYITRAIDTYCLGRGCPREALSRVTGEVQVISFNSDWLYPPHQSRELAEALRDLNKPVEYQEMESRYGHDSFLLPNPPLSRVLHEFLSDQVQVSA